ncbi:MAG: NUDIX hydrolase [Clostridia bacterium]|nr:NUDIX hydrolase [Clostridia bacterium]
MARRKVSESVRPFEGVILSVRVDQVELEDGRYAPREVVEHKAAVSILPVDRDSNVYLVRQYRHAVGQDVLEAPAGLMEEGESPEQAALREVREETGAVGTVRYVGDFYPTPGYCEEIIHLYVAEVESFGDTDPDEDEFLQTVKLPFSEFYQMALDGRIRDGKTVVLALRGKKD